MHDFLAYLIKHNAFVQGSYRIIMGGLFRLIGLFVPMDDKLVLLSSYGGKQYSDSPKILFEAMKKDPRFEGFHYVWAFEQPDRFDVPGAEKVKTDSLPYFMTALKAKVWITNVNIERGLNFKKAKTVYLDTWHGTGPKKGGNAVKGRKDYDFSRVDIFCCDGQYTHDVFIEWFNATDESMLWCGRPREDELVEFTEEDRKQFRKELGIPDDKKMILYMPTWREHGDKPLDYDLWKTKLSTDYIMCVRDHHFTKNKAHIDQNSGVFIDGTTHANVNELYAAADVLISDYSSAFFDYGLLGKPMFCYAYDYDDYKKDYGLFMDLENEFPNGVFRDETKLIDAINAMNYQEECAKCKEYVASYVSHPVNATQCCLDMIAKKIEEKK